MPSVIEVEEIGRTHSRPIDEVAKQTFLAELEETGSYVAAAMAARPHLSNKQSAVSAFRQLEARDPDFRTRVLDALAVVAARGEAEIHKRAFEGVVEKVKYATHPETGELIKDSEGKFIVVEQTTKFDNNLLVAATRHALRRIDPDAWSPPTAKKHVTHSGHTSHLSATVDLDKLLEGVDRNAREQILKVAQSLKALPQGKDPIDVDAVDVPPAE